MKINSWQSFTGLILIFASISCDAKVICWQSHLNAQLQDYEIYRKEQADQDGDCHPGDELYLIHTNKPSLQLPMMGHTVTAIQELYVQNKNILQITVVAGGNATISHFFDVTENSITPVPAGVITVNRGHIWTSRDDQGSLITETQSTTLLNSCQILVHATYTYTNDGFVLIRQWEDNAKNCGSDVPAKN